MRETQQFLVSIRMIESLLSPLLGNKVCAASLASLDITVFCVKLLISKGLGIGIVLGGAILKVPQIIKIVGAKSGKGISFASYFLETVSYTIGVCYNWRNQMPISTYGEGTL